MAEFQLLIGRGMQTTFALRRQEIVTGDKTIKDLLAQWPALNMESQVFAEFHRITNVNLRNTFYYAELDRHTKSLVALYRQKASHTGKIPEALQRILREYDMQEEQDINLRRTLSLRALSVYLREDDTDFYKSCNQDGQSDVSDCPLGLLSSSPNLFIPGNLSIVIEGNVVFSQLSTVPEAFLLLFGLIYVFNIEYPKKPCEHFYLHPEYSSMS
ncbi:uncharacterized protein LOC129409431 [Boleophthalmus pectinirostris]|uniref:uncharacterized protein LOC129409431 n=1 Tax=Boleophthalmus pectinirostris TaxID=150288 RepID=UPI00242A8F6B|nr:uncharacterized protein LOC129409431 [Boleophthalmus pectinirostris]